MVQHELRRLGDQLLDQLEAPLSPPVAGETLRLETRAMGCPWFVILNPGPPRQVMVASDAFDAVRNVEHLLTIYRDDSEVAAVNLHAAAEDFETPFPISSALVEFLQLCDDLYRSTAGAFDPAAGSLIQLWKQARLQGRIPTQEEIDIAAGGWGEVDFQPDHATLDFRRQGIQLDLASIGKGYGIDAAVGHLRHEELDNFLVHGGFSSVYASGTHGDHTGWPIGLKNPLFTEHRYATLLLQDAALSTSGSNVQYFRHGGKRYGHLLDPRTGWPADQMLSVTVVAPTATVADALSTAFYVMGLDNALQYCDDHPEIGAILVPPPTQGRRLEPVVKNLPPECLFWEADPLPNQSDRT